MEQTKNQNYEKENVLIEARENLEPSKNKNKNNQEKQKKSNE